MVLGVLVEAKLGLVRGSSAFVETSAHGQSQA